MKSQRQVKILELIKKNDISTQEELCNALIKDGFNVTQATVSRDIRELNLTKTTVAGRTKYVEFLAQEPEMNEKYVRVLKEGYLSMDRAQNILVIRTVSGMAGAVCAALDALMLKEVVGSVAGDDTILCAVRTADDTIRLMDKLKAVIHKN
jgi:transcriptional regulator of arginine metabolism